MFGGSEFGDIEADLHEQGQQGSSVPFKADLLHERKGNVTCYKKVLF